MAFSPVFSICRCAAIAYRLQAGDPSSGASRHLPLRGRLYARTARPSFPCISFQQARPVGRASVCQKPAPWIPSRAETYAEKSGCHRGRECRPLRGDERNASRPRLRRRKVRSTPAFFKHRLPVRFTDTASDACYPLPASRGRGDVSKLPFSSLCRRRGLRTARNGVFRRRSLSPSLLLSAKGHARLACSVVNALATARCRYQPFAGYMKKTGFWMPQKKKPLHTSVRPSVSGVRSLN